MIRGSSTASLNSSIFEYRQKYGRTYQNFKDAEYWYMTPEALKGWADN